MRNILITLKVCMMTAILVAGAPVLAAEMDHSSMLHDKSLTVTSKNGANTASQKLVTMPASGKAREGGYDDRYVMESTDVSNALQIRCAQASRGLVMMNNAEWSRCGGKPEGAVQASRSTINKVINEHVGHNM